MRDLDHPYQLIDYSLLKSEMIYIIQKKASIISDILFWIELNGVTISNIKDEMRKKHLEIIEIFMNK